MDSLDTSGTIKPCASWPWRRATAVWAAACAAVVLAGCGHAGQPTGPGVRITPPAIPAALPAASAMTTTAKTRMPLDDYLFSYSGGTAISAAIEVLTAQCMRAKGFVFPAEVRAARRALAIRAEPYGINDLAQAARYGYAAPRAVTMERASSAMTPLRPVPRRRIVAYWLALTGTAPAPVSHGVPPAVRTARSRGCLGAAAAAILRTGQASRQQADLSLTAELAQRAFDYTRRDPRVSRAIRAWSACMAVRGFRYASPFAAAGARWPVHPDRTEIATATADVTCKRRAGLPGLWLAVQAGYENELIAANRPGLRALARFHAAAIRRAEQVLRSRR